MDRGTACLEVSGCEINNHNSYYTQLASNYKLSRIVQIVE